MNPDKVRSLQEVVASVPEGAHVALGGFAISGCPIAFVHEMIRQRRGRLTLSQAVGGMDTDLLVGAGLVETLIFGGGSLDRAGLLNRVNEAILLGRVRVLEQSSLAITLRYHAGALGILYIPTRTLLGSEMLEPLVEAGEAEVAEDPFEGQRIVRLRALRPDVAVLHVQMADRQGNCRILGPTWDNLEKARAARRTVVLTEELVDEQEFRRSPEGTVLSGLYVDAVVPLRFSAYPTACYRKYDYDFEHLRRYATLAQTEEGFAQYLEEYVLGTSDHEGYLSRVGEERLRDLVADPERGY
jgi:acyl CoA:acetate/3-ketoacid CoA transferase alpha subunit